MRRFFTLIIFLLAFASVIAQEAYVEHTIVKGETVYAISKIYDVTIDAIFELNPSAVDIIYPGEILRIPNGNKTNTSQNNTTTEASNLIDYKVKRGDTKFGLSKKFGASIAMLEQQNPHIIAMLQAGHTIKIDKSLTSQPRATNKNEHTVVKGETLWGISKRYNVGLNNLISVNSNQLSEFLQIGQILTIPSKNEVTQLVNEGQYLVQRGETKFGLAKRFNMTIAELEEKNPQIIPMLMAGHTLNVTATPIDNTQILTENTTEETETAEVIEKEDISKTTEKEDDAIITEAEIIQNQTDNTIEKGYVDYTIQPQETLYSLSKKADMTIGEFINLNPKLLVAVKKGDIIKMPSVLKSNPADSNIAKVDSTNRRLPKAVEKNTSLISNLDLTDKNGIYFYLPFSDKEFNSRSSIQESAYLAKQKYYEFYEGAQMAIDSAKALNLKFDVTLVDNQDGINSKFEIKVDDSNSDNAIIIPFLEPNAKNPKIISDKNVILIDVESQLSSIPNTTIYNAIASEKFQKLKVLNYLAGQKNANIISITDLEEAKNKDLIIGVLPETTFLKVDKAGFFTENQLNNTLKKNRLNYVILDSEQTIIFLNTTTALMGQLAAYDIQLVLLDSKLLPKQNEASEMRFKILKLIYPTLAIREDSEDLNTFELKYLRLYNAKPSINGIKGFDVTLDLLLRLSQASDFENSVRTILNSEHIQYKFNYKKINSSNYTNTRVYLMQFNTNEGSVIIQ